MTRSSEAKRARFACIHHSKTTRNTRKLEERVEKDSDNVIITDRKRNATQVAQKDCHWEIYWSVRSVGKRGSGTVAGQLGITELGYSYLLAPNLFVYRVHLKTNSQF